MKTKFVPFVLLSAGLVTSGAWAQSAEVATPSTPAPAVTQGQGAAAAPNQMVYSPRLPSVNELTNIAAAQGLTVDRIEQTASQVTVVYRYANGKTNTVAYLLLPGTAGATAPTVATSAPPPPPAVVYETAPRVVYYDTYGPGYYGYPGYWYPPVSLSLGFGYRGGGYRGGYYGGFRGGFHHR